MRVVDALALGVRLPAETRDDCVAYRWHEEWDICTSTRTAIHRTGLEYHFQPWTRSAADALPDVCTWPPYQWVAKLTHPGKTRTGTATALRRCLEAGRLFSEDGMFLCCDCNVDTRRTDYYMVHTTLWKRAMPDEYGMLCISCLERRLGRRLVAEDFTDCRVNTESEKVQLIRAVTRASAA